MNIYLAAFISLLLPSLAWSQQREEALGQWAGSLVTAVEAHWDKKTLPKDRSCSVAIQQNTKGDVLSATVAESCGSRESDAAMLKAVWKASPLPLPKDRRVFDTDLIVTFTGE